MSRASNVIRLPTVPLSWDDCRLLVETVVDYAIFMLDAEGRVATWNIGAEKIKGYEAHEIIGEHFSKFYPPEDVAAEKPRRELEIAARVGRVEDEGWRVRKDGSRFWASAVITALRDESGKLRGFGKVTRDLTARRNAEEELRRAEERFHHLVDAVIDYAIFILDETGRVSTWNAGAHRLKGYTAEEIIGKHFSTFYTDEDRAAGRPQMILETVRREGRFEDEGWRVRKDGTRFWANVVISALRDDHGKLNGFAKVTRDLTSRREAEETNRRLLREQTAREVAQETERQLRSAVKTAEEASRAKDEFLATVSHELRTPLTSIVGWSTILRRRVKDPSIIKPVEVIHRNAQAQAKIIDDILDVSRVITGKLRLDPKPTDFLAVTRDAVEIVRPSADAKKIDIEFAPAADLCLLVADPERLQQVVWNLLSNAVKFTDPGGRVRIHMGQEGSQVVLVVTDTGRGIDPSFLPVVFDRFRQADSSVTRRVGGLGLGLALVRHIVELHGGRVSAASEGAGKGATFTVTLPIQAVMPAISEVPQSSENPQASEIARTSAASKSAPALDGIRVLVVDDEADARDLIAVVLLEAGAVVETAGSAAEGFAANKEFRPDVLVSDIGMPGEDGFSFIRKIRTLPTEEGGRIPSLALTAFAREEDRTKALSAGYTTHIGKPVNPDALVAAVANLAGVRRRG
jgi:PAS domain S-box-containing protein